LVAVSTVVAVALGGGLNGVIEAQILGGAGALVIYVVIAHRLRIARLRVRARVAASILRGSAPFLLWTIVMTCDASVHAVMLSKLAPGEVVGWYAAATRFSSVLIFPATILAAALYPTLSRLFIEQPESYRRFVQSALRAMFLLGALGAGGTLLFADDAVVLVYGQRAFGPAAATLRVLALYIFLDFVNITLGTAIMAANRQTPFIYAKGLCILLVISLNSLLIPLCQTRLANGSLGSAITSAAAEIVMLGAGLLLVPRGTLAPALLRDLARAVAAMAVMAGVTHLLGDVFPGGGIALGVLTYVAVVVGLGGVRREDVALLRSAVRLRSRAVAAGGP
jgi:O-antigen/teichoic acid export membrane protein